MSEDKYKNYDSLVRGLGLGQPNSEPRSNNKFKPNIAGEVETFRTSEDRVNDARLRELEQNRDPRDHRTGPIRAPEESVYFRVDRSRSRKFTEEELISFREGCRRVIVHDYSPTDFYHISDEVRAKNDQLARISMKLGGLKRIYRSIDQYIMAMRVVYEAWSILADNNKLHTREEFFDYIAKGIIVSNRIIAPKMRGIDQYNKSLIMTYIANTTLDPKDLMPAPVNYDNDDYLYATEEEQKFMMDCMLDPNELERIVTYDQLPDSEKTVIVAKNIDRKFLKAYDDGNTVRYGRKKKKKHSMNKVDRILQPDISALLKRIVRKESAADSYNIYTFSSLTDSFDKGHQRNFWDKNPYRGSWQDNDKASLYDLAMTEEHMKEVIPGEYGAMTYGDKATNAFYKRLESAGISVVELRRSGLTDNPRYLADKKKASRKQNRKMETAVLSRIGRLCDNPDFKKLIKKSEQSLDKYRKELQEESD